jgi:hypothetical protein
VIHISYTLRGEDGETRDEEVKQSPHVPQVGELICFDQLTSYQVVDVLWHLGGNDPYVKPPRSTPCSLTRSATTKSARLGADVSVRAP